MGQALNAAIFRLDRLIVGERLSAAAAMHEDLALRVSQLE
jgi:hypothetical protein